MLPQDDPEILSDLENKGEKNSEFAVLTAEKDPQD